MFMADNLSSFGVVGNTKKGFHQKMKLRLDREMDMPSIRRANLAKLFRKLSPDDVTGFGKMIGKSQSATSDLLQGRKSFGEKMARSIEKNLQIASLTLDKKLLDESIADDLPHPTDDDFAMVPQLDIAASCGDGCFHDHVVVKGGLAFKRSSLRDFGVPESAARIIYAKGGSMWPSVKDGCVVLLNTADREPKEGRVFAICTPDGDLVLKRLVWEFHPAMGAQTWIMRSDNPDKTAHPDKILPPDDRTMIAGLAVWNDNRL